MGARYAAGNEEPKQKSMPTLEHDASPDCQEQPRNQDQPTHNRDAHAGWHFFGTLIGQRLFGFGVQCRGGQ
jgi:hypothetical protein